MYRINFKGRSSILLLCIVVITGCVRDRKEDQRSQGKNGFPSHVQPPIGKTTNKSNDAFAFDSHIKQSASGSSLFFSQCFWVKMPSPPGDSIIALAANTACIFAYTNKGLFRSADSALRWDHISTNLSAPAFKTIALVDTALYGATDSAVYRLKNIENRWVECAMLYDDGSILDTDDCGNRNVIDINICKSLTFSAFTSRDSGKTWMLQRVPSSCNPARDIFNSDYGPNHVPSYSPVYSVLRWSGQLFTATDGGVFLNGSVLLSGFPDSISARSLSANERMVLAGTNKGIFQLVHSDNTTIIWNNVDSLLSDSIIHAQITAGRMIRASAPTDNNNLLSTLFQAYIKSGKANWAKSITVKTTFTAGKSVFKQCSALVKGHYSFLLFQTSDNGITWSIGSNGLPRDARRSFSVVIDSFYFIGIGGIDTSANDNDSKIEPGDIYRSVDSGITWSATKSGIEGDLDKLLIIGKTLLAACSVSSIDGEPGRDNILQSLDYGKTWTPLPGVPAFNNHYAGCAEFDGCTFLATKSGGIFYTLNSGKRWNIYNLGLSETSFRQLFTYGDYLWAATDRYWNDKKGKNEKGLWRLNIPNLLKMK
jgi:hypothetical protein